MYKLMKVCMCYTATLFEEFKFIILLLYLNLKNRYIVFYYTKEYCTKIFEIHQQIDKLKNIEKICGYFNFLMTC